MRLFLVRHGRVDHNNDWNLNEDGKDFARRLPDLLPHPEQITFLCYEDIPRCLDTVSPLIEKLKLPNCKVKAFSKSDFLECKVLQECKEHESAVICYRIESINNILRFLEIPEFTDNTRDASYSFIYDVTINETNITHCRIKTKE